MVSGILRGLETFSSHSAWDNPDLYWVALLGLVNWVCNVVMPLYVVLMKISRACSVSEDGSLLHFFATFLYDSIENDSVRSCRAQYHLKMKPVGKKAA